MTIELYTSAKRGRDKLLGEQTTSGASRSGESLITVIDIGFGNPDERTDYRLRLPSEDAPRLIEMLLWNATAFHGHSPDDNYDRRPHAQKIAEQKEAMMAILDDIKMKIKSAKR